MRTATDTAPRDRVGPRRTCAGRSASIIALITCNPAPTAGDLPERRASWRVPGAAAATSSRTCSASGTRSALVSTTSGVAPLSQASARKRSMRPRSGSGCRPSTTTARSTLAAEHLAVGDAGRDGGTDEGGTPGQDGLGGDPAVGPGTGSDPVADARRADPVGGGRREQGTREGHAQRAAGRQGVAGAAVDAADAGRDVVGGVGREVGGAGGVPAEGREVERGQRSGPSQEVKVPIWV